MVPPIIPDGEFSPVRLEGRYIRRAFPSTAICSRRAVCLRPSCTPPPVTLYPRSMSRSAVRCTPPFKRPRSLYPRGPRSGPSYVVSVHHHLIGPMRPTRRRSSTSPHRGLYALPSLWRHTSAPRRPASGSELSLVVLYRHVALCDPGMFVGCMHPVPSPTTLAFDP
jgi:hypothetical protein